MNLLPWPDTTLATASWEGVRRTLERCVGAARRGRLPGTLMLIGDPGMGREALAVELAAALICGTADHTSSCHACDRIHRGVHPDLTILDVEPGATQIKIDQCRRLVEGLDQLPYEGSRRVVIVSSCQTPPLNWDSASSLLKALEEPPAHVTFVLLAANPMRVLPTIVSRSVGLRLPPPRPDEAARLLAEIHGVAAADVTVLLERSGVPAALLMTETPDSVAALLDVIAELAPAALAGDGLAVVRLGALSKIAGSGAQLIIEALLRVAARPDPDAAEELLGAAAAVVRADHRRAILHLDPETAVAGTLARLARRAGS